ncbi:MAG: hypothetical protein K2X06_17105 [Burkholderiales bacterium]|nr:hypothetical protein [Burkholderiales bacterium]
MFKRKNLALTIGALLFAGVLWFAVWPFITGGRDMQAWCLAQRPGATLAEVRNSVQRQGYRITGPDKDGRALIHDPRSFGRFLCAAQFAGERLLSARYQGND